ncbi:alpha/beta hydrolase [Exilibacterium tricleocarpae]|uniref:Alpha/beta hydrolase n=1 Tax=Exilibacterium tricleocarpae TaxID=2591008 RepID=A0A545TUY2_9GAMM|nr:alpha/beta hydrolase [Exilibacterium tricleocarpae]TQV81028.1 alpha/beta hydrolase [Exilibacterium tricleocarpae]
MRAVTFGVLFLSGLVIVIAVAAMVWSALPISVDRKSADPAVIYANTLAGDLPEFQEGYFEFEGRQLHYVEAGEGDPIVLVHGFPSYWYSLIRQANDLRRDHRVILIDGLGAGRSDAPNNVDAYKLDKMVAHFRALLDELGIQKTHLVGHDWGAVFVYGFAQRHPEKTSTVTGISSPTLTVLLKLLETNARQQAIAEYIERFKQANSPLLLALGVPKRIWENPYKQHVDNGLLTPEEGKLFRRAFSDARRINAHINWYRANIPAYTDITETDYWPSQGASITVPALYIWGSKDHILLPEIIPLMRQIAPNLHVIKYEGVGHWPHLQRSEEVTAAIRKLVTAEHSRDE